MPHVRSAQQLGKWGFQLISRASCVCDLHSKCCYVVCYSVPEFPSVSGSGSESGIRLEPVAVLHICLLFSSLVQNPHWWKQQWPNTRNTCHDIWVYATRNDGKTGNLLWHLWTLVKHYFMHLLDKLDVMGQTKFTLCKTDIHPIERWMSKPSVALHAKHLYMQRRTLDVR